MTDRQSPRKRSISIKGHRTSLSLEPIFWDLLRQEAAAQALSIAQLVGEIDAGREANLSSAVRVYLTERLKEQVGPSPN